MSQHANNYGVPDLGARQQIVVVEHRILTPATCELMRGGLIVDGCGAHLRIIDIPKGHALYVPLNQQQVQALWHALD